MSLGNSCETYHGLILSLQDALLVLEATRLKLLPNVRRRLNSIERKQILEGLVFAWNESECGMKRWTDGKYWLASKVKSPFLTYQEYDETRNVKPNGLVKQIFSLTTKQGEKLHLVAYYDPEKRSKGTVTGDVPSQDSKLLKLRLDPLVYLNDIIHCYNQEPYDLRHEGPTFAFEYPQNQPVPPFAPISQEGHLFAPYPVYLTPPFIPYHYPHPQGPPFQQSVYVHRVEHPRLIHAHSHDSLKQSYLQDSGNHDDRITNLQSFTPNTLPLHEIPTSSAKSSLPPYHLQHCKVPPLLEGRPKSHAIGGYLIPTIDLPANKGVRLHPDDRLKLEALDKAFSV